MTAKEFFSRAYRLDQRIQSKSEQIESLNELATKCTSAITGMPRNPSPPQSVMADAVCKIIDLQEELKRDMTALVQIKQETVALIKRVESVEYQIILEKRYLCYLTWEQIAVDLNYSIHHLYKLHNEALTVCDGLLGS